ncbi:hypothetical protein NLG97_g2623 [Lecanicillium saksenae]|uniref:Uncharacterized protein n=1 Tax=Lecanicillium saksenae TaxID=468837 RepID=A0ACC1R3T4_9HYPO|nr:hypothetical protein NLG97_g2623 [Lecanicillium saksenae]
MTSVQLPSARVNVHPADHHLNTLPTKVFDVICIGTGWASRVAAARIVAAGFSAAVVEDELVGGDCPFWACVPSKVLLRPSSSTSGVISEADFAAGAASPARRASR